MSILDNDLTLGYANYQNGSDGTHNLACRVVFSRLSEKYPIDCVVQSLDKLYHVSNLQDFQDVIDTRRKLFKYQDKDSRLRRHLTMNHSDIQKIDQIDSLTDHHSEKILEREVLDLHARTVVAYHNTANWMEKNHPHKSPHYDDEENKKREEDFKNKLRQELSFLQPEPLKANLFLRFMCAPASKWIASLLLVAGLGMLTFGVLGLVGIAPVVTALAAFSASSAVVTSIGGATTALTIGFFSGSAIARHKIDAQKKGYEESEDNQIATTGSYDS